MSPAELTVAVHDNLRHLGLDVLDVVNLRGVMGGGADHGPAEGSIEEPLAALAELQRQGLIRHLGLSNVTAGAGRAARHRRDRLRAEPLQPRPPRRRRADRRARRARHRLRAVLPAGRLHAAPVLDALRRAPSTRRRCRAPAWLLHRSPNILLIPGTSSPDHLRARTSPRAGCRRRTTLVELDAVGHRRRRTTHVFRLRHYRESGRGRPASARRGPPGAGDRPRPGEGGGVVGEGGRRPPWRPQRRRRRRHERARRREGPS